LTTNSVTPEGDSDGDPRDLRATGARIETLLEAASAGGAVMRERAEELVRLVVDLYGSGLERILEILHERGHLDDEVLGALAADDLVASLLLVHGLHPEATATRVERALDGVRPYLGSHHGDVELLGITDAGVVRLRLLGSCDGCASSSATLTLAVEGAVLEAAPEVTGIEVEAPSARSDAVRAGELIPLDTLRVRHGDGTSAPLAGWEPVPELAGMEPGQVRGILVGSSALVVCRLGSDLLAFRDACARCGSTLADGTLERRLGSAVGEGVLRCSACHAHYDVRGAGIGIDRPDEHLDPVPLLTRQASIEVAVPRTVGA
jgi:Fe-S cluster biogenesis protein NfuA